MEAIHYGLNHISHSLADDPMLAVLWAMGLVLAWAHDKAEPNPPC